MDWSSGLALLYVSGLVMLCWAYFAWRPGAPREWIIPEGAIVLALLLTCAFIYAPLQYPAVAWRRPLVDRWLSAGDAALGISVPALAAWTAQYPWLVGLLTRAYFSLLPQFAAPVFLLPLFNDRDALWEFAWHFVICSVITVACLALWPAACVFSYLHFPSLLNQSGFIRHFSSVRDGTMTAMSFDHLEGMVSCPSFHVAGAWMATHAFRRTWLVAPLAVLNAALVASTVLLGAHYAVDLLATGAMVAVSWWLYRRIGRHLH